jgi:hypothetical protein
LDVEEFGQLPQIDVFRVPHALRVDPLPELVTIDNVGLRDAGVTEAFDVVEESAKALLPPSETSVRCFTVRTFGRSRGCVSVTARRRPVAAIPTA